MNKEQLGVPVNNSYSTSNIKDDLIDVSLHSSILVESTPILHYNRQKNKCCHRYKWFVLIFILLCIIVSGYFVGVGIQQQNKNNINEIKENTKEIGILEIKNKNPNILTTEKKYNKYLITELESQNDALKNDRLELLVALFIAISMIVLCIYCICINCNSY